MTYSNLSKIKPKLRTQGNITGNFGRPKSRAGSPLQEIGVSSQLKIQLTHPDEYLNRLYRAFDRTTDAKMKQFLYQEIRKILIQRNQWK